MDVYRDPANRSQSSTPFTDGRFIEGFNMLESALQSTYPRRIGTCGAVASQPQAFINSRVETINRQLRQCGDSERMTDLYMVRQTALWKISCIS